MAITIPGFEEDRGPLKADPKTGSTLSKEASYCRDLKGCGDKEYLFLEQAMSINDCDTDECQRRFLGSVSIKVILYGPETEQADVDTMINYVRDNLKAAHKTCPETGGGG